MDPSQPNSLLMSLPTELLHEIVSYLPSWHIKPLRFCCKSISYIAAPHILREFTLRTNFDIGDKDDENGYFKFITTHGTEVKDLIVVIQSFDHTPGAHLPAWHRNVLDHWFDSAFGLFRKVRRLTVIDIDGSPSGFVHLLESALLNNPHMHTLVLQPWIPAFELEFVDPKLKVSEHVARALAEIDPPLRTLEIRIEQDSEDYETLFEQLAEYNAAFRLVTTCRVLAVEQTNWERMDILAVHFSAAIELPELRVCELLGGWYSDSNKLLVLPKKNPKIEQLAIASPTYRERIMAEQLRAFPQLKVLHIQQDIVPFEWSDERSSQESIEMLCSGITTLKQVLLWCGRNRKVASEYEPYLDDFGKTRLKFVRHHEMEFVKIQGRAVNESWMWEEGAEWDPFNLFG